MKLFVTVVAWVVWLLMLVVLLVLFAAAILVIAAIVRALLRVFCKWHRNRYRRAYHRGKFEICCDAIVASQKPYGPGLARTYQRCGRPAHWMLIGPGIVWGTGEKRCWRHHRRSAYMLGRDGQNIYMPVNRRTAWVEDPPPVREESDV